MSGVDSSLGAKAARGVLWTGGGQILRQLVQITGQLVLARLLAPDDFGLLGMALVFVGIGQLLVDFGIGAAIVQSTELGAKVLSTCFWINLGIGVALMLLMLAAAPLIARFYTRPDLLPLVALLSLNLLLSAALTVPMALLSRSMRFADLARAQVMGSLGAAVVAIGLASAGAGAWALIAQPLAGSLLTLLVAWRATRWWPRIEFSYDQARPLMRFSFALLGTNLVGYGNRNVDGLLIGRVLGAGPLGTYSMAIQIMLFPLQQISSVIVKVLFPTLVQIGDDLPRLRSAYLKAVATIAMVTFPLMTGLFALADDLVQLLFGAAWAPMAPILQILCWVGLFQSVGTTVGVIYLSTGKTGMALKVSLVGAPVIVGGIVAGLPWGIIGVAGGYAMASLVLFYYVAVQAFKLIDLKLHTFHAYLVRPLIAASLMCLILLGLTQLMTDWGVAVRFVSCVIAGGLVYSVLSCAINREHLVEVWRLTLSLRQRR